MNRQDIDRILSKGDRTAIESLVLRILRDPLIADKVEELYSARSPATHGDAECYAGNAYEAAHWLALLSRELYHPKE